MRHGHLLKSCRKADWTRLEINIPWCRSDLVRTIWIETKWSRGKRISLPYYLDWDWSGRGVCKICSGDSRGETWDLIVSPSICRFLTEPPHYSSCVLELPKTLWDPSRLSRLFLIESIRSGLYGYVRWWASFTPCLIIRYQLGENGGRDRGRVDICYRRGHPSHVLWSAKHLLATVC